MAIFVFGLEAQQLGRVGDLQCSVCNSKRTFNAAARYGYFEVGPFGVAGLTRYSIACAACRNVWPLDGKQAKAFKKEGLLVPPDVPPLRKFGLLASALVIAAMVSLSKFGPLVTAGSVLAIVIVFALPGVISGVRNKGLKAYTKGAVSADRPVSLFESVGGVSAGHAAARETFKKCLSCGLNNGAAELQCERCGASLSPRARPDAPA